MDYRVISLSKYKLNISAHCSCLSHSMHLKYIFCSSLGDRVVCLFVAVVPPLAPCPPTPPAHSLAALVALVSAAAWVHLGAASHAAALHTDPAALVSGLGNTQCSASSDVRAQVTWQPAALITSLQHCSTCLQPSVFSLRPQQEYLGLTQGPHPHSLPHLGRSSVTIMASHGHCSYLPTSTWPGWM